jgi:hypothetical protein
MPASRSKRAHGRRAIESHRADPGSEPSAVHQPVRPLSALRRPRADPRALRPRLRPRARRPLSPRLPVWPQVDRAVQRAGAADVVRSGWRVERRVSGSRRAPPALYRGHPGRSPSEWVFLLRSRARRTLDRAGTRAVHERLGRASHARPRRKENMSDVDLRGRVAIVTGAGRGIGAASRAGRTPESPPRGRADGARRGGGVRRLPSSRCAGSAV